MSDSWVRLSAKGTEAVLCDHEGCGCEQRPKKQCSFCYESRKELRGIIGTGGDRVFICLDCLKRINDMKDEDFYFDDDDED